MVHLHPTEGQRYWFFSPSLLLYSPNFLESQRPLWSCELVVQEAEGMEKLAEEEGVLYLKSDLAHQATSSGPFKILGWP